MLISIFLVLRQQNRKMGPSSPLQGEDGGADEIVLPSDL